METTNMLVTIKTYPHPGTAPSIKRTIDTRDNELTELVSKTDPYIQFVHGRYDTYVIDWHEVLEGMRSLRSTVNGH